MRTLYFTVKTAFMFHTLPYPTNHLWLITNMDINKSYCDVFGYWPLLNTKCDVFTVLKTPFGLLFLFIYDFTSSYYNYFHNVAWTRLTASSLPCWFFILVGPLIAGFLAAALIWLFDLLWRCVSDQLLWSARHLFLTALKYGVGAPNRRRFVEG
jgi:hypothetical protein